MQIQSDQELCKYVRAPSLLLSQERRLAVNIYVYFPKNRSIVLLRRASDILSADDLEVFKKYSRENILIEQQDQFRVIRDSMSGIADSLGQTAPDRERIANDAASILMDIGSSSAVALRQTHEEVERSLATLVSSIEDTVLTQFQRTRSVQAYERVLNGIKKSDDPVVDHCQRVSAIAILIALAVGHHAEEEVVQIGIAGLLHDLGLRQIPAFVANKYLEGENLEHSPAEKLVYMRHPRLTCESFQQSQLQLSPVVFATIENHHENYDGTGFKGLIGTAIPAPARVLRLADEAVSRLQNAPEGQAAGLKEILTRFHKLRGQGGSPVFDPNLTAKLLECA